MYSRKIKRTNKMSYRKRSKKRTNKVDKKKLRSLAKKYKVNYKKLSNKKIAKNLSQTYLTKKAKLYILPLLPNNRKKSLKRKKGGVKIETTSTEDIKIDKDMGKEEDIISNLYNFFKTHNFNGLGGFTKRFINFKTKIDDKKHMIFTFTISEFKGFKQKTTWDKIACNEYKEKGITYKTDCDIPGKQKRLYKDIKDNVKDKDYFRTKKVFFKIKNKGVPGDIRHLYDYIKNIQSDDISETDHNTIFEKVFENLFFLHENGFQLNVINHNLDVPFLHFKFV